MFARRYFAARMFAPRYFPQGGAGVTPPVPTPGVAIQPPVGYGDLAPRELRYVPHLPAAAAPATNYARARIVEEDDRLLITVALGESPRARKRRRTLAVLMMG